MQHDRGKIYLITFAALVMTLPTLGVRDLTTSHEGRVAQTARQMAASGWPWSAANVSVPPVAWHTEADGSKRLLPDPALPPLVVNPWLVPVLSGEIRLQKPPLPYWSTAVCFKLFGVNEWAARLVPTLMWALLTLIVADLAAMLLDPNLALWAAGIWISSYFGFDEFRKAMADPYLAFFSIAAVWAGVRGMQNAAGEMQNAECGVQNEGGEMRNAECKMQNEYADTESSFCILHSAFCILFYLFLALGFLAKGPAVFVPVIAGLLPAWSLLRPGVRRNHVSAHVTGVVLFLLISLPWYAFILHRVPNALLLWKYESIGGFGEKNEKPQPLWFYLPQLLLITLPWTPVWVAGIFAAWRERGRGAGLIWMGLTVLVFSLITQKKNAYLLPALAALTLIVTQGLAWLLTAAGRKWPSPGLKKVAGGLIAVFAIVIATAFPLASHYQENRRSARAVCEEVAAKLPASGAAMQVSSLSPDAAFYLPIDWHDQPTANLQWVMLDDRPNQSKAEPAAFAYLFNGRTVRSVRRVPLDASPVNFRWKVYEVALQP